MTATCACGGTPAGSAPMPTAGDLEAIGRALLNYVATVAQLGHTTPAETLTYVHESPTDSFGLRVVRDFTAWTARRGDWQSAECRLRHYVSASGWHQSVLSAAVARLVDEAREPASP